MKRSEELKKFRGNFPDVEEKVFDYFWEMYLKPTKDSTREVFDIYNEVMGKRLRMIDDKFRRQWKKLSKYYSVDDFRRTIQNAKDDDFHVDNDYKYLTPEYITRTNIWDKYFVEEKKKLTDYKGYATQLKI